MRESFMREGRDVERKVKLLQEAFKQLKMAVLKERPEDLSDRLFNGMSSNERGEPLAQESSITAFCSNYNECLARSQLTTQLLRGERKCLFIKGPMTTENGGKEMNSFAHVQVVEKIVLQKKRYSAPVDLVRRISRQRLLD